MSAKIHGETEIVLKNVKTGLVERIRSENTFQGQFLSKYLRNTSGQILTYPETDDLQPLWKSIVGGLFLFKDPIQEGTQYMPAGNIMVGAGVNGFQHSGAPNEWGSYNETESSAGLSGITQVYDFTTDQANGEIGCVCLASRRGAQIGYGHAGSTYLTKYGMAPSRALYRAEYQRGAAFKDSDGKEWALVPRMSTGSSDQIKNGKMYFVKRRFGFNKLSVFNSYEKQLEFDLTQIGGNPFNATGSTSGSYYMFHLGGAKFGICVGGVLVSQAGKRTIAAGGTIDYYELDADAETLTAKAVTNSTGDTINYAYSNYNGPSCAFTRDNCILCPSNTSSGPLYKINLTTGITEKAFPDQRFPGSYEYPDDFRGQDIAPGLQLYTTGKSTSNPVIYDTQNDTLKLINLSADAYTEYNEELDILEDPDYSHSANAGVPSNNALYLATINNINSVTKTAAQTMKVTYTLTEV